MQDGPDKMAEFAKDRGLTFPYLYDESQDVARWLLSIFDMPVVCIQISPTIGAITERWS
jgi:hypothetical protein